MRPNPVVLLLALLLALAAVRAAVPAARPGRNEAVRVQTRTRPYQITGSTAAEIWSSIQARGPRQAGGRYAAYTDVRLRWTYRYAPRGGACVVTEAQVDGMIEIHLPEWQAPAGADPELVTRWDRFVRSLRRHEEGHQQLGTESAQAIHHALASARAPSCQGMDAVADAAARAVDREYAERARAYDHATGFGRTQGAYWTW